MPIHWLCIPFATCVLKWLIESWVEARAVCCQMVRMHPPVRVSKRSTSQCRLHPITHMAYCTLSTQFWINNTDILMPITNLLMSSQHAFVCWDCFLKIPYDNPMPSISLQGRDWTRNDQGRVISVGRGWTFHKKWSRVPAKIPASLSSSSRHEVFGVCSALGSIGDILQYNIRRTYHSYIYSKLTVETKTLLLCLK